MAVNEIRCHTTCLHAEPIVALVRQFSHTVRLLSFPGSQLKFYTDLFITRLLLIFVTLLPMNDAATRFVARFPNLVLCLLGVQVTSHMIECPPHLIGLLIGRGGSTIKRIKVLKHCGIIE